VAIAECCISRQIARETPGLIGARIDLSSAVPTNPNGGASTSSRLDALLFGETQSRVVVTSTELNAAKVIAQAKILGVTAVRLGSVGGDQLSFKTAAGESSCPVSELHDVWWNAIARAMV
jgi:phosphoribosylformylglycinamidine synthase